MTARVLKDKTCKQCATRFTPHKAMQAVCGLPCAIERSRAVQQENARKVAAKRLREGREKLMTLSDHLKLAQKAFNRWVRLRDFRQPCISCQRIHLGKWNAGHYLPAGPNPELRFEPDNCHRQCEPCNSHLSSNAIPYRVHLIEKIGLERVEWLEGPHDLPQLRIDDVKLIKDKYNKLGNALAKEQDNYTR